MRKVELLAVTPDNSGPAVQSIVSIKMSLVKDSLTLLHSERPKLHTILAFLSAIGLSLEVHLKSGVLTFLPKK